MPSSPPSSNDRLPAGPWTRTWLAAAALALLALAGMEGIWRWKGFEPRARDGAALWSIQRRAVRPNDPLQTVMIGASRILLSMDLQVFHEEVPGPRPIQLAVAGESFWPVFLDLAKQKSFTGIVICSAWDMSFLDSARWEIPDEFLDYNRKMTLAEVANQRLDMILENHLALLLPETDPRNVLKSFIHLQWPGQPYLITLSDRSRRADFSVLADLPRRRHEREEEIRSQPPSPPQPLSELLPEFQLVEKVVQSIQSRGGRVIFVRLPSSGILLQYEEKEFPRHGAWDLWCKHTSAMMIHYQDYPELTGYDCPDFTHLDRKDGVPFTRALARIIRAKLEAEGRFSTQRRE